MEQTTAKFTNDNKDDLWISDVYHNDYPKFILRILGYNDGKYECIIEGGKRIELYERQISDSIL